VHFFALLSDSAKPTLAMLSEDFASIYQDRKLELVTTILLLLISYPLVLKPLYDVYLHPLSAYPGPKLYAASILPICWSRMTGQSIRKITAAHAKYGPVVRIAPSELSFTSPEAWKHIYGHRNETSIGRQMPKDPAFYDVNGADGPRNVDNEIHDGKHAKQRKIFSHAFSDRALRDQEGLIGTYVGKFVGRLKEVAGKSDKLDLVKLFNFTTFDVR